MGIVEMGFQCRAESTSCFTVREKRNPPERTRDGDWFSVTVLILRTGYYYLSKR